jgi:hypothetical protein
MSTVGGRELKFGGAKVFERKKVKKGNVKSRWIAMCSREGRRKCLAIARFEPLSLVRRHSKITSKTPTN